MRRMSAAELRKEFVRFFQKRGHKVLKSSSLIPADPTSLFTSAGMQQFVPYLAGKSEPPYRRACSVQKCVRVDDIEEVGDESHFTLFEMLGNWSFGDYFKERAIDYALEFLTKTCEIPKEKLWVTIFKGEGDIPRDNEALEIWKKKGFPKEKIFEYGSKDNFWGPVTSVGPCGPCSEIFYEKRKEPCSPKCHPNCDCGRFVEIWNLVFMEYKKTKEGKLVKLAQQNVDTGLGLERILSVVQKKDSAYETDLFSSVINEIEALSKKKYKERKKEFRVVADHIRAISFIRASGVLPSNTDRGYVLRRLLRRMFRFCHGLGIKSGAYEILVDRVLAIYGEEYPGLAQNKKEILETIVEEEKKFRKALKRGLVQFEKIISAKKEKIISGREAFNLYQNYGFPFEMTRELAQERGFDFDEGGYKKAMKEHQKESKKGAQKKFGGVGIANLKNEEEIKKATRLHTATHLLQAGLRSVLGKDVKQMGSDITPERLRFDFSFPNRLSDKEIEEVEEWVNNKIKQDLPVSREKMGYNEAISSGALAFFKARYPKEVFVYSIGNKAEEVSKEICAGPHAKRTGELGTFKIIKQESAGANIRRIKAVLRPD